MATPVTYPWVGGTEFISMKSIPIEAPTVAEISGTHTAGINQGDTWLRQGAPSTKQDGVSPISIASYLTYNGRIAIWLDINNFGRPSSAVTSAVLRLYYYAYGVGANPVGRHLHAYELTNITASAAKATWDHADQDTATDWTGGHDGAATDIVDHGDADFVIPGSYGACDIDVTEIVKHCIDNHANIVRILVKDTVEDSATLYNPQFRSQEYATASQRPSLRITWAYTPTVQNPYTIKLDVFKGSPSVEEDTVGWNVNSRQFKARIACEVLTRDAIPANKMFEVYVDTKSLVDAGASRFFSSSTASNAQKVEWTLKVGDDTTGYPCKYCTRTALGVPEDFNTTSTLYRICTPQALSADTLYTFYLYVDADRCADSVSSNWSPADVYDLFWEDFATDAANLAAFLAAYDGDPNNEWVKFNDPIVSVSGSVLTVTGANAATMEGLYSTFNAQNMRLFIKLTASPGVHAFVGMIDTGGFTSGDVDAMLAWDGYPTYFFRRYVANVATDTDMPYHTSPWELSITKDGTLYTVRARGDAGKTPDRGAAPGTDSATGVATDVAHKLTVGSFNVASATIDYFAAATAITNMPIVKFPAITYLKPGALFCEDCCINWPFDLALALEDATVLYIGKDTWAQLTRQPGDSLRLAVQYDDTANPLSSNRTIYAYIGHSAITTEHDHWSPDDAWDSFNDFDDVNELLWHNDGATAWTQTDMPQPPIHKGIVGNTGGRSGRVWAGRPQHFSWNDKIWCIWLDALWEYGGNGWPLPYVTLASYADTVGQELSPGVAIDYVLLTGWFQSVECVGSFGSGGKVYTFTDLFTAGMKVGWTESANLQDPDVWSYHSNVTTIPEATRFLSIVHKFGSTWYVFFTKASGGAPWGMYYRTTTDNPEDWDNDSFSAETLMISTGDTYMEDADVCYDGDRYWHVYGTYGTGYGTPHYRLDEDAHAFPGATYWVDQGDLTLTGLPPWAAFRFSPRVFNNVAVDSNFYIFFAASAQYSQDYYRNVWLPTWFVCCRSTTLDSFAGYNTDTRLMQSSSTGFQRAYRDDEPFTDFSIEGEPIVYTTGRRMSGIGYRYDQVNNNGYFACFDYNTADPKIRLFRCDAGTLTEIGTAYSIPEWPEQGDTHWYHGVYPWELKVDVVGGSHKVYYSAWGNPWVLAKTETDGTYLSGYPLVGTYLSTGFVGNVKVRKITNPEPTVGQYASVGGAGMILSGNL